MGFKKQNLITIVGLSLLLFYSSCEKECKLIHYPIIPMEYTIKSDTINISDSIIISVKQPNIYQDFYKKSFSNFKNYNFNLRFFFAKHDNLISNILEENYVYEPFAFKVRDIVGKTTLTENGLFVDYPFINDSMIFKFVLYPQKKGLFRIAPKGQNDLKSHQSNYQKITTKTCDEFIEMYLTKFNEGKTNKYLIQHFDTIIRPMPLQDYQIYGNNNSIFYFYVK
jgi:hypothetical protein